MLSRHHEEMHRRSLKSLIAIVPLLSSSGLLAGETSNRSPSHSATALPFTLSTQQEDISLNVTDALLKTIVERRGRELDILVDAYISESQEVTVKSYYGVCPAL